MAIVVSGISCGYGKNNVLCDFSANFEKGNITCIVGRNGCGKSTLLKTIIGSLTPSKGEILVDEKRLLSASDRAKKIAFLSQGKTIPDMTVFETVLHGRFPYLSFPRVYSASDREKAFSCLKSMGLENLCDRHISTLSGGMRQKVYIAMALCQDTEYILLDEPTTYLDISNVFELFEILRGLADAGKGIVAVLHDLVTAFDFSDRVLVMSDGKNILLDSPDAVAASGIIKEVFGVGMTKLITAQKDTYIYERDSKNG